MKRIVAKSNNSLLLLVVSSSALNSEFRILTCYNFPYFFSKNVINNEILYLGDPQFLP